MRGRVVVAMGLATVLGAGPGWADEELLYSLGGGEPINLGGTQRTTSIRLGIGTEWDANLTCGKFDMGTSVRNQLNGATGALHDVMGNVMQTATGVVASLPALAIQRLNPGLYDLLQNGVLDASQEFRLARLRCEEIAHEMGRTVGSEGWASIARAQYWRRQMVVGGRDALDVRDEADEQGLDEGVEMPDGKRGGAGQPPIEPVANATAAGWNQLLGRAPDETGGLSGTACPEATICEVWSTPRAAGEFLKSVVGDVAIRTCGGCEKVAAQAGVGLPAIYRRHRTANANLLRPIVQNRRTPPPDLLESLSERSGMRVSRAVIEAIREEPRPTDVADRLAGELAVSQTLREASMARQALVAGMRNPHIQNNGFALAEAQRALDELDAEVRHMEAELRIKSLLASNTSVSVLRRQGQRRRGVSVVETEGPAGVTEGIRRE